MRLSSYVPSFYFYKLAEAISGPYTSLMAYQSGAIDQNGNILKPESSIDSFEYLVIKLKKIFEQLPYGTTKAKLGNYMSTLQLFGEHAEQFDIPQEQYHCLIEGILTQNTQGELSYLELLEDMSVGAGGGAPGSLGTPTQASNQGGIAGFDPKMGMPLLRRKPPKYFDNCEVFDVCPEEFMQFKAAKQWTDVPDSETKNYLQRFQRRNKSGKMAVKSLNPLNGEHEMHWITYPAKNFMEDIDLSQLNFLFENKEVDYSKQFRDHISTLLKRAQEKESSKDRNKNAAVAELHARIFNHINNFTKVRSNPNALKHYMEHAGVKNILGNTSSNEDDTHIITGFDEQNLPIIKTFDVKNVSGAGKKNVYVRQYLSSQEISQMEHHDPQSPWVTDRQSPQNLKTSDRLYTKGSGIVQKLKKSVESYLGQAKGVMDNLRAKLSQTAQSKQYMIRENNRFYLVDHNHFDIARPEISVNWGTPTYRSEGKRRAKAKGEEYVDPHANLTLYRGQASLRAGLKDTFRDKNNRTTLDTSALQDIESMLDDESKKHFSTFVKTYS